MARDDDDQVLREKRSLDILCVATARIVRAFSYDEKGETFGEVAIVEDTDKKRTRRVTNNGLSKRHKIDECESQNPQQNPNPDASSPSLCPVESKRPRQVVSNKAGRRRKEPVRRRKAQVRRRKPGPERGMTSEWLVNVMREVNGTDVKLIKEKKLTASDLTGGQARLLIPWNGITDMDFLNERELKIIDEHHNKRRDTGVDFTLVDSRGKQWKLNIRRWDMTTSPNYILCTGWNNVIADNRFVVDQKLWIWSFHSQDRLYIAFVPPDPAPVLPPDPAPVVTRDSGQSSSAM